jgi:glycerol-3-phosphate acyltransferase PlsX
VEAKRIAVDAVGGDQGAPVVIAGALAGARSDGLALALVGPSAAIQAELARHDSTGVDVAIVEAPDQIGMDEHPAQAVRRKKTSSIVVGIKEVRAGRAAAMVSAGNSGAVLAAALFELGMVKGIERPAIASYFPTVKGFCLFLDLGAVTDPKPTHLVDWALMGRVYAERILGVRNPTVGLLSNGEEPTKGNRLVQETYPLLAATPGLNFVGNVEGKDLPAGAVDVVVTDGFTGNVALKTAEGAAAFLSDVLRKELTATLPRKLAAWFLRPAFRTIRDRLDYSVIGGAPLLGIDGTVVIAHGRSNQRAIASAVRAAKRAVEADLPNGVRELLATTGRLSGSPPGAADAGSDRHTK